MDQKQIILCAPSAHFVVWGFLFGGFWGPDPLQEHFFRSKGARAPPRWLREDFATISDGFGPPFGGHFGAILEPCRHLVGKSGHTDSKKGSLERGPESGSKKGPFWFLPGGRQEGSLLHDSSIFTFSSLSLLASFLAPFWSHFGSQVRHYTLLWSLWSPTGPPSKVDSFQFVYLSILGSGRGGAGQGWPPGETPGETPGAPRRTSPPAPHHAGCIRQPSLT